MTDRVQTLYEYIILVIFSPVDNHSCCAVVMCVRTECHKVTTNTITTITSITITSLQCIQRDEANVL